MLNSADHKTLIFDMMGPKGHIRLNTFYLSELFYNCQFFVCRDLLCYYQKFKALPLGEYSCGESLLQRLMVSLRVVHIVRQQKAENVVFLSYDLLTFPLVSNVLHWAGVKVICFEHNTAPSTRLRRMFHSLSARAVRHFVYTPYLEELYNFLGLDAVYVPHPCLSCETHPSGSTEWKTLVSKRSYEDRRIGFCPSGSVTITQMEEIARLYADVLFVMKSKESSRQSNLISVPYLQLYGDALSQCDFVVVPFASTYKVSGPVFEAIAMKKPVLVQNNAFGKYLKALFRDQIFYVGEAIPTNFIPFDTVTHNEEVIRNCASNLS